MNNRRSFIKQASCISGACFCGFTTMAQQTESQNPTSSNNADENEKRSLLVQSFVAGLMQNIQQNLSEKEQRKVFKNMAQYHYTDLDMDSMLKPYENNLESFIDFLQKEWGWIITIDKKSNLLMADENKNYCVCPMINQKANVRPNALCYCSEGFAERMFSKVVGHKVNARVISSVIRGDKSCVYKIQF